jgi:hypothetical protein
VRWSTAGTTPKSLSGGERRGRPVIRLSVRARILSIALIPTGDQSARRRPPRRRPSRRSPRCARASTSADPRGPGPLVLQHDPGPHHVRHTSRGERDAVRGRRRGGQPTEDSPALPVSVADWQSAAGNVVADLIHLIAELVENATSYSPPESRVDVTSNVTSCGNRRPSASPTCPATPAWACSG